nr:glycoside hydrolase family 3 C-terminal domain-containing protein [Lactococcus protaetiae]
MGRVMESFGEDALLSGLMGAAMIEGYQGSGNGTIAPDGVVACLKHFAAYGAPDAGRDYASVDMSMKEFFGFYAKSYELALKANPRMVMASFNSLNGEPATASKWLLEEILRGHFAFDDLLISDWGAVSELTNHGVAADDAAAGLLALEAGIEIEMVSNTFLKHGANLAEKSPELLEKIDHAVWKILELKNELGLFEQPYADSSVEADVVRSDELVSAAKTAAKKSCVLLKNDNEILPLSAADPVLIIGPFAKTQALLGNWNCKGKRSETISVENGFRQHADRVFAYEFLDEVPEDVLVSADSVLVTLGEAWDQSGEGHSSANLELSSAQQSLIFDLKALGKKVIGLGFAGRPLALGAVIDDLDALLWTWYLGNEAGSAIAELVLGLDSPTGRLPMSFPRVSSQVPLRYNELRSGRPANDSTYSSRYQDLPIGPLFSFGHGLRYGQVSYENIVVSSPVITDEQPISLSLTLTNLSEYDTAESLLLFMEDPVSNLVRPVRELLDFKRIPLKKGEAKRVEFSVSTDSLSYVEHQGEKRLENGEVRFYINDLIAVIGEIEVVK